MLTTLVVWNTSAYVNGWFCLAFAAVVVFGLFLLFAAWLKPFSVHERNLINKIFA
jgi:hypothetical protein